MPSDPRDIYRERADAYGMGRGVRQWGQDIGNYLGGLPGSFREYAAGVDERRRATDARRAATLGRHFEAAGGEDFVAGLSGAARPEEALPPVRPPAIMQPSPAPSPSPRARWNAGAEAGLPFGVLEADDGIAAAPRPPAVARGTAKAPEMAPNIPKPGPGMREEDFSDGIRAALDPAGWAGTPDRGGDSHIRYSVGGGPMKEWKPGQQPSRGGYVRSDVTVEPADPLERQQHRTAMAKLRLQEEDPEGLGSYARKMQLEAGRGVAIERGKQGAMRETEEARRRAYQSEIRQIEDAAQTMLREGKPKADVDAVVSQALAELEQAYGLGARMTAPGLYDRF